MDVPPFKAQLIWFNDLMTNMREWTVVFVVKSWLNLVIPDKIDFVTDGLSYPLWKKFPLFFSSFVSQEMEGENPPGISQDRFSTI